MNHQRKTAWQVTVVLILTLLVFGIGLAVRIQMSPSPGDLKYLSNLTANDRSGVNYATESLQSNNALVRNAAARGLGQIGPLAEPATPALIAALSDSSPQVVASAAWALGNIRSDNPLVIRALIGKLDDKDGEVRRYAAYGLSLYGPKSEEAIPSLTDALQDKHIAYMAARALGEIGNAARVSIPDMAELLSSTNEADRAEAAYALSRLKPLSPSLESAIIKLQQDPSSLVREIAQRAVTNLQDTTPSGSPNPNLLDILFNRQP